MAPAHFAITDIRIFDGDKFIDNGYVEVKDGRIAQVAASDPSSSLSGIPSVSRPGHTLLPGLIDCHIHADQGNINALKQSIRFGVTTVMDMHNEHYNLEALQALARDPKLYGSHADIKFCGLAMTIPGGWPEPVVTAHDKSEKTAKDIAGWPKLTSVDQVSQCVKEQVNFGAGYIKLMHESGDSLRAQFPLPSKEIQTKAIQEARSHGLIAVAHALCYKDTVEILECGVDGLTHSFCDGPTDERYIELYLKNKAHCNPTLSCIASLTTEGQALQTKYAEHPLAKKLLTSPPGPDLLCRCMGMANDKAAFKHACEAVAKLYKAGVPILVGSDAAGPALGTAFGLSIHQEMWHMHHDCSIPAIDVLKGATSMTADRFGFKDRGRLATGLKADMLLIKGDPVEHFASRELVMPITGVWRNGVPADDWAKDMMA